MKPTLLIISFLTTIFLCASGNNSNAQYFLKSAGGTSGIVTEKEATAVNYSVTDSRLGFSISTSKVAVTLLDSNGFPIIPNLTQLVFNLGIEVADNTRNIFSKNFTPGFDGSVDLVHFIENKTAGGVVSIFARIKASSTDTKYLEKNKPDTTIFTIGSKTQTILGIGGGINYAPGSGEHTIVGLSGYLNQNWNSAIGLDEQDVSVFTTQGKNSQGSIVTIAESNKRFVGALEDLTTGQIRLDFIQRLGCIGGNTNNPLIGLLASVSYDIRGKIREHTKTNSWNIAVGPTINPKRNIRQIIFSGLFEINDIDNSLGLSPKFNDKFRFRLYVGIPFSLLK